MNQLIEPPRSIAAEHSVIGCLMKDNSTIHEIPNTKKEEFYDLKNGLIFSSILNLHSQGSGFDVIAVSNEMEKNKTLDRVGGLASLAQMVRDTPSVANIKSYAKVVSDRHALRELHMVGRSVSTLALDVANSPSELISKATDDLVALLPKSQSKPLPIRVGLGAMMNQLIEGKEPEPPFLQSGFRDLDKFIPSMNAGDLVILDGRPSMGKTTFAMNLAHNFTRQGNVQFFTLETTRKKLQERFISMTSTISHDAIRKGKLNNQLEVDDLKKASQQIALRQKLIIDETAAINAAQLEASARQSAHEYGGLKAIIIDYVQLMSGSGTEYESVTNNSKALKRIAKSLGVVVIALCQLNRSCEERPNKRPKNSDLRSTGQLEQDAEIILHLYRHSKYLENMDSDIARITEVIIGKQKDGETGTVHLLNDADKMLFSDAPYGTIENYKQFLLPKKKEGNVKYGGFNK